MAIEYRHKWDGEHYVRVAKPATKLVPVEIEAGQVRGSKRTVYVAAGRPRAVSLQDHHVPAKGTGRTTSKRSSSSLF